MSKTAISSEITFGVFWKVLRRRFLWVLSGILLGAVLAFGYSALLVAPSYACTAEFQIKFNEQNSLTPTSSSYLQGLERMTANVIREISGTVFLDRVRDEYNGKHGTEWTTQQISRMLEITEVPDTSSFNVKVSAEDPGDAYGLLEVLYYEIPDYFNEVPAEGAETATHHNNAQVRVDLISRGRQPTRPVSPNIPLNTLLGALALGLAVYVVWLVIDLLDKTIEGEEAVRENFDIPVVGQIPDWRRPGEERRRRQSRRALKRQFEGTGAAAAKARDYKGRLVTADTPFSVTEAFKTLRTNLGYTTAGEACPVIGVTSDFAGAGKSLIAANTAVSYAQLGKRVLLIDADMRCPSQHQIFSLSRKRPGLSEALAGIAADPLRDCASATEFKGLDVIIGGRIPPNPAELLASTRMGDLLARAKEVYDCVILDFPPLCATTDAGVVSPLLTGYLMVVREGYSDLGAVAGSLETMAGMQANVLGFVVNDIDWKRRSGYGHYYGRSYGYGERGTDAADETKAG